ncbi:hypothetical protein [Streptosporangium vulgare]|uniref:Translation initiation factor 2 n=1 Tax=Streptosporangium vulgare TaxID=46190 RepID=A0ABV5TLF3_9ACTN
MIDPDSTQAVPASGRHRVRHWEDAEGYRTRPPYAPPAAAQPTAATPAPCPPPPTAGSHPHPQPPAAASDARPQPAPSAPGARPQPAPPASGARPRPAPSGSPAESGRGRLVYREEAMRRHVEARAATRMPLVISGPSFLLLWIAVAVVLTAGAALVVLALGAGG